MTSYFSCSVGVEQQFRVALSNGGMTAELVEAVGNNADLGRIMVSALKTELAKAVEPERSSLSISFDPIRVDYSIRPTDTELLKQEFDWVSAGYVEGTDWQRDKSCEGVPTDGEQEVAFQHVQFNEDLTTRQVLEKLDSQGLRPATFEEIRAFAKSHPDLQKEFWIVGLGTFCRWAGGRRVPCLGWNDDERDLLLRFDDPDDEWGAGDRFLAVRK